MTGKHFEPDDPMTLTGMHYEIDSVEDHDRMHARCLVEEYALSGFSALEVASLFERPAFSATHAILRRQGRAFVRGVINDVFGGPR